MSLSPHLHASLLTDLEMNRKPASRNPDTKFPLEGVDLSAVSDETLISLSETAPVLHSLDSTKVVRLSRSLALKTRLDVLPSEAENMRFAATNSHIPVPNVHRSFNVEASGCMHGTRGYIVMDLWKGRIWRTVRPL